MAANAQAPNITVQPVPQTVQVGDGATFSVTATGAAPLYYQWKLGTTNLPGATTNPLVLPNASYAQAGNYSVTVSNSVSTTSSDKALLKVVSREVWGWGRDDYGQATIPTDLSNVVAVACGSVHSLALRRDGTVAAWGANSSGVTNIPAGLSNVIAIACGDHHNLVLKADGTMRAWGTGSYGEQTAPNWTNIVAIAAGEGHNLALTADGFVAAWGYGFDYATAVPLDLSNVVAIACRKLASLALKSDGTVVAWGPQSYVADGLSDVIALAGGWPQVIALHRDGEIEVRAGASAPGSLDNSFAVAAGQSHGLALQPDGRVVGWGDNSFSQTNVPSYAFPAGSLGTGPASSHSLAVPAIGAPFIIGRMANQVWTYPPPASTFFVVQATGARTLSYQWRRNGISLPGETNALLRLVDLGAAQESYSVVVSNMSGSVTSSPATLTVVATPLQNALDNYLPWSSGGSASWYLQTTQTHDGVDAARSGAIGNNQESWLETTVSGPGYLSFWWRTSSEENFDFLEFHLDSVLQPGRISGETSWQQKVLSLSSGAHTLRWRYAKDSADSTGLDAGFLDQVAFSTTLSISLANPAKLPNGSFQFNFTSVTGTPFTVLSSTNVALPLGSWSVLGAPTEPSTGQFQFNDPSATNGGQRFYRVRSP